MYLPLGYLKVECITSLDVSRRETMPLCWFCCCLVDPTETSGMTVPFDGAFPQGGRPSSDQPKQHCNPPQHTESMVGPRNCHPFSCGYLRFNCQVEDRLENFFCELNFPFLVAFHVGMVFRISLAKFKFLIAFTVGHIALSSF